MSLTLSRYAFPFEKEGKYLLYSSKDNSFYETNAELHEFLCGFKNGVENNCIGDVGIESNEILNSLLKAGIIVRDWEDDDFLDSLKTSYSLNAYSNEYISLTLAPTIQCNLRCPYCFEETKPKGVMSDETIDTLITFISEHECARQYGITWFGGEPLVASEAMRKILDRLSELEKPERIEHSIVTNGTLLNHEAISMFGTYPLNSMQITLDGNRGSHNRKRFTAAGNGTFDIILQNALQFKRNAPDTSLTFRINIDNSNADEYFELHELIREMFGQWKNVNTYPGILRANKGCESELFFSTDDHLAFTRKMREKGIRDIRFPSRCSKGCTATNVSSYVIGPMGEIYLCWEHIGIRDKVIGNINDSAITGTTLFNRFMNHGHCFDDPVCRDCGILPICTGGCPDKRIKAKFDGQRHQLCALYKEQNQSLLYDILFEYYLQNHNSNEK